MNFNPFLSLANPPKSLIACSPSFCDDDDGDDVCNNNTRLYNNPRLPQLIQSYISQLYTKFQSSPSSSSSSSSRHCLSSPLFNEYPAPSTSELSSRVQTLCTKISKCVRTSNTVSFIAMIYFHRIISDNKITKTSFHSILTACFLLAAKFYDDDFYATRDNAYVSVLTQMPLACLNAVEMALLKILHFKLNVTHGGIMQTEQTILDNLKEFELQQDAQAKVKKEEYCANILSTSPVSAFFDGFDHDTESLETQQQNNRKPDNGGAEIASRATGVYYCDDNFIL